MPIVAPINAIPKPSNPLTLMLYRTAILLTINTTVEGIYIRNKVPGFLMYRK